jgi:PAS domain S-box-containing protein
MYHLITNENKISIILNREINLSKNEVAISRTDIDGNILYYNNIFIKISGYKKRELLYMPHSILRHPTMPKAIFFIIWKTLLAGRSTFAIIKNLTKKGDYYWLLIKFMVQKDNHNKIISFLSEGRAISKNIIKKIEPLYHDLLRNEKEYDMNSSINMLHHFLNSNNFATYNDYICNITKEKREGFFSNIMF